MSKFKMKIVKKKSHKRARISHLRRPADMGLEQWQIALRRQLSQEQKFRLKNIGDEPVLSEFRVTNPQTGGQYRVAIRGEGLGDNYCSCPDFAVNTLGTCKHIEFTLGKLRAGSGGRKALAAGFVPSYSEVYLRYGARRQVVFGAGGDCPAALRKLAGKYFGADGVLTADGYGRFEVFLREAVRFDHDLRCYDDAMAFVARVRDQALLRRRIDEAFPGGIRSAAFKRLLKVDLYPYQRKGALFAASAGRSLIADDMGLGKTIQAVAAVEILARTMGLERVLIVCPTSLKHQWKQEIERFSERSAEVVEGMLGRRKALYDTESFYKIVNYEVVARDMEAITRWGPEMVILDEAQRIKNWKTRRAQSVKRLDSRYALVLTGTPLENRLEELHSIVEFVDRFHLGPLFRFLAEHQHVDETGRVVGYHNLTRISQSLEPILIRRTKKEVLSELPPRMEKNFFVPMTPQQQQHHEENRETVARIVAKWRRYGFLSETDQRRLMISLQNMRMSCNSTYLLDRKTDYGTKADELLQLLGEVFEQPDAKTVVFSQWVGTHEILLDRLKGAKLDHVLFHGGVPGPKRKGLVTQFKEDPRCRVFLSTDAGGVGLNLQNATTVVNMDLPWNPAVLEQRIGRIHRLGQTRPVRVVNFVAQGTIEHGMLSVLSFKKSLFTGVLDGGKDEVFLGGTRLQRFMESVDTATQAIPQPMPAQVEEPDGEDLEEGDGRESRRPKVDRRGTRDLSRRPHPSSIVTHPSEGWEGVVSAGLSFLDMLGKTLGGQGAGASAASSKLIGGLDVETDPRTGRQHLKVPMPDGATLQRIADVLGELARRMK